MLIKVAIAGIAGRMGRTLAEMVHAADDLDLVGGLERAGSAWVGQSIETGLSLPSAKGVISADIATLPAFDVLLDFTTTQSTLANLETCLNRGTMMVIGTTGFTDEEKLLIKKASKTIPIVMAPNMSVGVNVLMRLLNTAAVALDSGYDIEIVEAHHKHKVDAPSGTALGMGEAIADALGWDLADCSVYAREGYTGERTDNTIGFSTVRAGDIVGEHTAIFAGVGERIEISHKASDRSNFAVGAIRAAKFLSGKQSGLFDMQNVLGG